MNQLEAMQIFVRVAELGSFTQAADSMGLPKARVSDSVQQLEALLGTRLLHRTTRKVQMTHDGQVVYERSRDLLVRPDHQHGHGNGYGCQEPQRGSQHEARLPERPAALNPAHC